MHIANSRRCCYCVRVNKTANLRINVKFKRVRVTIFAVKRQEVLHTWFQNFAVFWILCASFWAIPRRLNFICRRIGPLRLFHLHRRVGMDYTSYLPAYEDGTVFRNVDICNSDAGELPRRKHTISITYSESWIKTDQLDVTSFIILLFTAQHLMFIGPCIVLIVE